MCLLQSCSRSNLVVHTSIREVQVCRRWGLLILEDDAYWFLNWAHDPDALSGRLAGSTSTSAHHTPSTQPPHHQPGSSPTTATSTAPPGASDPAADDTKNAASMDGGRPPATGPVSFLSLDSDARVIRVDTFAKVLGPGEGVPGS